ncbi:hypothetical protein [Stenotrophomonas maltophilia]|uniref:hypothetical protein n=1 Tax=Stenotrophomonas maltophilia TaxID=40324 RepID=UPI00126022CD|nr:hypothetical protein [Stenotrophomonas maltophilia]
MNTLLSFEPISGGGEGRGFEGIASGVSIRLGNFGTESGTFMSERCNRGKKRVRPTVFVLADLPLHVIGPDRSALMLRGELNVQRPWSAITHELQKS